MEQQECCAGLSETLKAYSDLTRAHFFFVWPLLFFSGLALAFSAYGGFSWPLIGTSFLISLLGFEAGLVLNDYVDREVDRRDVDLRLTGYWRPYGRRPIVSGLISPGTTMAVFVALVVITTGLIATLPYPHSLYLFAIMVYAYGMEYFYQVKKRNQRYPVAQLVGRTDFALFPVAGYLVAGLPDMLALQYFLFFYPWAIAHLGVNDMADYENDIARGLKTIPVLYGISGTAYWITLFSAAHIILALVFLQNIGTIGRIGFVLGFVLVVYANSLVMREPSPKSAMRALPVFHLSLLIYGVSVIAGSVW